MSCVSLIAAVTTLMDMPVHISAHCMQLCSASCGGYILACAWHLSVCIAGGMQVVEYLVTQDGQHLRTFNHKIVLASCAADTPAQAKLSKCFGHGAVLACRYCLIRGVHAHRSKRGTYFIGYRSSTPYGMHSCLCSLLYICSHLTQGSIV